MAAPMQAMMARTSLNTPAVENYPFNIYAGVSTGFVKGCILSKKRDFNLNTIERPEKKLEISCMCWLNHDETKILAGSVDGYVSCYSLESKTIHKVPIEIPDESVSLREIKSHQELIATAYKSGLIKCSFFEDVLQQPDSNRTVDINASADLHCMDHNTWMPNLIVSGGKENPLKLWDIADPSKPVFSAKNVKNDWLNLRVPVWVTKAQFIPQSKKIVTGTGYSQIRLYDPSSNQRRPVIEIKLGEDQYPITGMAVRPNSDFQVIVGNTIGTIALADLRKKEIVRHFKGPQGAVTDVKFHPTYPVFATCGYDRYVNCYDLDVHHKRIHSVYVHSHVNCLLFSSQWSPEDSGDVFHKKYSNILENMDENEESAGKAQSKEENSEDSNDEEVWSAMEVVQTKKRRVVPDGPKTETQGKKKKRKKVK